MEEMNIGSRLKKAWNAFLNRDPTRHYSPADGSGYTYRPDRPKRYKTEKPSQQKAVHGFLYTIRTCQF